ATDGLDPDLARARTESDTLPWDDMEASVSKNILWKSFQAAQAGELPSSVVGEEEPERPGPSIPPARPTPHTTGLRFWIHIPESAARHPEPTLARGQLRDLFASVPDAAVSYAGSPAVLHPEGATGLAILSAQFRGVPNLAESVDRPPDGSTLLYWLELTTRDIRELQSELKRGKVSFQSQRLDSELWSVIKKGYRSRTGLWAMCEENASVGRVLCKARTPAIARFHGCVTAILEDTGTGIRLLQATAPVSERLGLLFPFSSSAGGAAYPASPDLATQWNATVS
ncbi:MAG: hypothetical protein U1E27_11740, partial [Kiritimatiellia bacterium]|nr:hypothetical protein [Kiritimatiellia bacterium]